MNHVPAQLVVRSSQLGLGHFFSSFAFILGVLPLYFASGAGKIGRHSVGTAIVGGMLFSTVLNLFFIPVLYVIVKTLLTRLSKKKITTIRRAEEPEVSRIA